MCFEVFGAEKIDKFNIQMGEELTVSFDIDSNQWQDRWFNRIRAWKVERVGAGAPMAPGAPVPPPAPSATPAYIPLVDTDKKTPDENDSYREFFYAHTL